MPDNSSQVDPIALARMQATFLVTVLKNKWITHKPTERQALFLSLDCREIFYGGAAGGGKSDALLMAALQYFDVPGYAALLIRRSFSDLALPGALMDRSHEWLDGTEAHWSTDEKTWTNRASKSTITFGYLESDKDLNRYKSSEFQLIGFDELTEFPEHYYTFMFSRLRRNMKVRVPLRMRSASNPGNIGHEWVKRRFINPITRKTGRMFVPARLTDNEHIDQESYVESLNELDPVLRAQMLAGNWDVKKSGAKFDRNWWKFIPAYKLARDRVRVRYWDTAGTEEKPGTDPDYTVGVRMSMLNGVFIIEDVARFRATPADTEQAIKEVARRDHAFDPATVIWMEQDPGSAGISMIDHYARYVLVEYDFRPNRTTGDKQLRANPLSAAAQRGNVFLVEAEWNEDFMNEMQLFPLGEHDDQTDASSGAHSVMTAPLEGQGVLDFYKQEHEKRIAAGVR